MLISYVLTSFILYSDNKIDNTDIAVKKLTGMDFTKLPGLYSNYIFDYRYETVPSKEQLISFKNFIQNNTLKQNLTFILTKNSKANAIPSFLSMLFNLTFKAANVKESHWSKHLDINHTVNLTNGMFIVEAKKKKFNESIRIVPLLKPEFVKGDFACPGFMIILQPNDTFQYYISVIGVDINFNKNQEIEVFSNFDLFVKTILERKRPKLNREKRNESVQESGEKKSFKESMQDANSTYESLPDAVKEKMTPEQWKKLATGFASLLDEKFKNDDNDSQVAQTQQEAKKEEL